MKYLWMQQKKPLLLLVLPMRNLPYSALKIQLDSPELVEYYYISGQRGDTYRLPAASGEVTLPGAVRSL